ncbi:MAG: cytochrome c [Parvibaculaceae bacterium]
MQSRTAFGAFLGLAMIAGSAQAETPLERGTYLMNSIVACGNCHTNQGPNGPIKEMDLAGGLIFNDFPGSTVLSANITPNPETGIGKWSDADIINAIRNGKRPDGSLIGPPMPFHFYRQMSDDDVKAIVAYLRQAKPVTNKVERSKYAFPLPPEWGPPVTSVAAVSKDDKVAYGEYLAGPLGHCMECHSGPGEQGAPDPVNKLGAGGMTFKGPWGVSVAPNITPSGLHEWTDEEIKTAVTKGLRRDGTHFLPPMGVSYYANMTDDDLSAIIAYLRQLPPK